MLSSLSSQNVIQYLQQAGLCSSEDGAAYKSVLPENSNKNWNLLVMLADNRQLLIKQERKINSDHNSHEFFNEWLFHQLLQKFPVIGNIGAIASSLLHFDEKNSILVRSYLSEYLELGKFYDHSSIFPPEIAIAIGTTLAGLHRATFNKREYRDFMATAPAGEFRYNFYNPAQGIPSITPETFGTIPTEALQFYRLYQQYESLESAIADLAYEWKPCCLTHNDLQLSNILVHSRWEQLDNCLVRLIDWEACAWGDPAFDLGTLLASYLRIWLSSLIVDPTLELEESLNSAMIPLEILQPSILALIRAYLDAFPMILEYHRDFIMRVIKFTGLALIQQIQNRMECQKYFDHSHVCMFQIAKNLLIMPEQSVLTIFGISELEIFQSVARLQKLPQPDKEQQLVRLYYEKTRLRGC
ncbi:MULTISPECIES: aminoglycoside phosphotransferase family protein [unclassified Anabaena]|uniref:aminoglycoside phosphotransferase family protein n=1 Tax=unclassified Anabaena TaxID=2619674 RepID=UPI001446DD71|nr:MULTISPECIES: aminoglycoside phosphotransferase family protein [unclassified Anabaena]MTJ06664.1 aminoglycoside phosphotransferase family protein [Anabaena sp. UHCC 0204]MTJ54431.1 aminoglycoside phosphotransferase family protein [Anabaena sp. UHCC 0253]